jgi:dethiobiotin synthetase
MFDGLALTRPGLFITATDTDVGKTVVTSALALALRRQQPQCRLGVSKPFSSGCRKDREGLVNPDAEALAHFADCREPLAVINPLRYQKPLAPAVAADELGEPIDWSLLAESLHRLEEGHDLMLIEGVGGVLVPLDPSDPQCTVLTFMQALGYPAVIVARAGLGTLNHTAMTARLLREAGVPIAGIVMNQYDPDAAAADDPSFQSNRQWLERLTGAPVLAVVPKVSTDQCQPQKGILGQAIVHAMAMQQWRPFFKRPSAK